MATFSPVDPKCLLWVAVRLHDRRANLRGRKLTTKGRRGVSRGNFKIWMRGSTRDDCNYDITSDNLMDKILTQLPQRCCKVTTEKIPGPPYSKVNRMGIEDCKIHRVSRWARDLPGRTSIRTQPGRHMTVSSVCETLGSKPSLTETEGRPSTMVWRGQSPHAHII